MSSYMFTEGDTTYGDGEWTLSILNDRANTIQVDRYVIRLYYS